MLSPIQNQSQFIEPLYTETVNKLIIVANALQFCWVNRGMLIVRYRWKAYPLISPVLIAECLQSVTDPGFAGGGVNDKKLKPSLH